MKTVVIYNIISFIILVALIFVLRIVSKSNLGQFTRNYTQTTKRGLLTTNKG